MGWYQHSGKTKDTCYICGKRIKKGEKFYFMTDGPDAALGHFLCVWQKQETEDKAKQEAVR
jgi:hypothetical protein